MSSITTPDPDRTPPSGYRTAENRPGAPDASPPRDLSGDFLAKYIEDIAREYANVTLERWTADSAVVLEVAEEGFAAGYARAREDFGL